MSLMLIVEFFAPYSSLKFWRTY